MPSVLFTPMLELAFSVARKGEDAEPRLPAPSRLVPLLRFTRLPSQARQTTLDVLDGDPEFRDRVLGSADELSVGRVGMAFLERGDGWEDLVEGLVEADAEPVAPPNSDVERMKERVLSADARATQLEQQLATVSNERDEFTGQLAELEALARDSRDEARTIHKENVELIEQRKRAVTELKRTEEVMARHVAERKRLEEQIAAMTAAQLNTSVTGGAISDRRVRAEAKRLIEFVDDLKSGLDNLHELATPVRRPSPVRTALPLPPGLHDDSIDVAEYLVRVPGMCLLVDGYNVTREAHDEWPIEDQRDWLRTSLTAVAARTGAKFDVVFDGADVDAVDSGHRQTGVSIRFSPADIEADDVIIEMVASFDMTKPVTVVSSDRRVRTGTGERGANLLYSHQLLALL